MSSKVQIKWAGFDSCGRAMFQAKDGTYLVDTNKVHIYGGNLRLCTKVRNQFDGEPFAPLKASLFEVVKEFK